MSALPARRHAFARISGCSRIIRLRSLCRSFHVVQRLALIALPVHPAVRRSPEDYRCRAAGCIKDVVVREDVLRVAVSDKNLAFNQTAAGGFHLAAG